MVRTEHGCQAAGASPAVDWDDIYRKLDAIIARHKERRGALIAVLHDAQEEIGFLPKQVQVRVADGLGVPLSEVYGVATFYALFSLKPKGKYKVSVCKGTACYVRGSPRILERFEKELGVRAGDTTGDGLFTLEVVRCLGACGLSPVLTVNKDVHARLKADRVPQIIGKYLAAARET